MRTEVWLDDMGQRWRIEIPTRRAERRRGLLGRPRPGPRTALALLSCRSVHTIGMRFAIDVIALDGALRVRWVRTLRPGRVLMPRPGVHHLLETRAGSEVRAGERFLSQGSTSIASPPRVSRTSRTWRSGAESWRRSAPRRR
jgi:uncharacterized protein